MEDPGFSPAPASPQPSRSRPPSIELRRADTAGARVGRDDRTPSPRRQLVSPFQRHRTMGPGGYPGASGDPDDSPRPLSRGNTSPALSPRTFSVEWDPPQPEPRSPGKSDAGARARLFGDHTSAKTPRIPSGGPEDGRTVRQLTQVPAQAPARDPRLFRGWTKRAPCEPKPPPDRPDTPRHERPARGTMPRVPKAEQLALLPKSALEALPAPLPSAEDVPKPAGRPRAAHVHAALVQRALGAQLAPRDEGCDPDQLPPQSRPAIEHAIHEACQVWRQMTAHVSSLRELDEVTPDPVRSLYTFGLLMSLTNTLSDVDVQECLALFVELMLIQVYAEYDASPHFQAHLHQAEALARSHSSESSDEEHHGPPPSHDVLRGFAKSHRASDANDLARMKTAFGKREKRSFSTLREEFMNRGSEASKVLEREQRLLESEAARLKDREQALQDAVKGLHRQEKDVDALRRQVSDENAQLKTMQRELEEFQLRYRQSLKLYLSHTDGMQHNRDENNKLLADIEHFEQVLQQVEQDHVVLKQEREDLEEEQADVEQRIKHLREEIARLEKKAKDFKDLTRGTRQEQERTDVVRRAGNLFKKRQSAVAGGLGLPQLGDADGPAALGHKAQTAPPGLAAQLARAPAAGLAKAGPGEPKAGRAAAVQFE